ncbi:MAG: tRNA uridine-5-carboxymethylaminomethyl(34) synthesis GTPase MnmE [Ruminococcaceae bacterium]|nr:tRNA uridine-5-carboxymethylaminomethyl(34) synthesis GTPase MnmE [Oscillospiraceae bacterium]
MFHVKRGIKMSIIASIATGQAVGGIGIVRLSGEGCIDLADRVFACASGNKLSDSAGYRAHYGSVSDGSEWQDEAVAIVYRAPKSYTGEDVVELCCHGGPAVTRMALRACIEQGAQPAAPGEYTRRAFENGKLSLAQAEAVMSIISAEGRQAALAAQAAHDGRLNRRIDAIAQQLIDLSVRIAAWCDYPDEEEIPEVTDKQLTDGLSDVLNQLVTLRREGETGKLLREGVDTVICGKPNVGKSTLMNLLSGCERSIVTDIPGTTRDVVEEQIRLDDCVLRISDTAGLHDTSDQVEKIGVERTWRRLSECALVLAVFDGSKELDDDDRKLIDSLSDKPTIAVVNKSDQQQKIDIEYISNKIQHTVYTSALKGDGLAQLTAAIMDVTQLAGLDPSAGMIINERQCDCVRRAAEAVEEALNAACAGVTFDAVGVSIQYAIDCLLELTGERASDRIVDGVFAQFCVGK